MLRIAQITVVAVVLAVAYGLYQLHATKQREQQILTWSNRLVWDALGAETQPRFVRQTVTAGAAEDSWRVTGYLAARDSVGEIEGPYDALVLQSCASAAEERCWELSELTVDGVSLLAATEAPATVRGAGADESPRDAGTGEPPTDGSAPSEPTGEESAPRDIATLLSELDDPSENRAAAGAERLDEAAAAGSKPLTIKIDPSESDGEAANPPAIDPPVLQHQSANETARGDPSLLSGADEPTAGAGAADREDSAEPPAAAQEPATNSPRPAPFTSVEVEPILPQDRTEDIPRGEPDQPAATAADRKAPPPPALATGEASGPAAGPDPSIGSNGQVPAPEEQPSARTAPQQASGKSVQPQPPAARPAVETRERADSPPDGDNVAVPKPAPKPASETAPETVAVPAAAPSAAQPEQLAALPPPEAATGKTQPTSSVDPGLLFLTQDRLLQLGYGDGRGLMHGDGLNSVTRKAILAYQVKNGFPATGLPSRAMLDHMEGYLARLDAIASGKARPSATPMTRYAPPVTYSPPVTSGYASYRNGLLAAERGRMDEAIAHYTRAIESADWRERHMAYLSRGRALVGQGRHRQAINDYSAAIRLRPDLTAAWINRGLAFAELQQRERALADLRQGQRLDPGNPTAAQALRYLQSRSAAE